MMETRAEPVRVPVPATAVVSLGEISPAVAGPIYGERRPPEITLTRYGPTAL
jgi:hypothetical protein